MTRKVRKSKLRKSKKKMFKGGMFKAMAQTATKMAQKYAPKDMLDKAKEAKDSLQQDAKDKLNDLENGKLPNENPPTSEGESTKRTKIESLTRLIKFSLGSLIISPLYIMAVIANIPLNTLNNLSGKSFNNNKADALGVQLYKYMFEGYKKDNKNDNNRA